MLVDPKWAKEVPPSHNTLLKLAKAGRDSLHNVNIVTIESVEKGVEII